MKKLKRSECEWKTCVRVDPKGWDFCSEYPNMTVIRLYNRFCVPKHSDKMRFFGVGHCLAAPRQPPPKNRRKSSQKTRRKPNLLVQKVCSEWNIKYWMHRLQKKSIDTVNHFIIACTKLSRSKLSRVPNYRVWGGGRDKMVQMDTQ